MASELAKRVAAKFLAGKESDDTVAAIPKSKPGLQMFRKYLDTMEKALDEGDSEGFDKAMGELHGAWKKVNP
jgi:hypothetical protein